MPNLNISTLQNYYLRELNTMNKNGNKNIYHRKLIVNPMVGITY